MANKLKPLELADALEKNGDGCTCCAYASFECCCEAVWGSNYTHEAAAEIRRLHNENKQLQKTIEAEREACAKVCEDLATDLFSKGADEDAAIAEKCAASIWNRSETQYA